MNEDQFNQARLQVLKGYIDRGLPIPEGLVQKTQTQNPFAKFFGFGGGASYDPLQAAMTLSTAQRGLLDATKSESDRVKEESKRANEESNRLMADLIKAGGADPEKIYEIGRVRQRLEEEGLPFEIMRQRLAGDEATRQSVRQLEAAFPLLDEAGRRATGRALAASERFMRQKQQMPTTIQDIMASKQNQMTQAQAGEAALMNAVANQQAAAKQFAGRYAGKFVSAG